jgi:putative addiction module component (TIGR02574 family)
MNDEIAALVAAAARLPAAERHELIEAIADTLADEACEPLSSEWKAELERRVAESDAGIGETVPRERRSPEPTSEELVHLRAIRESIAEELLDLVARDQLRRAAREEPSISGAVRGAIHRSELPLRTIAATAGLSPVELDEFLTGERTRRSDALDRLAATISFEVCRSN